MGLKSVVANAIGAGFNALGASGADGLQASVVYTQVTTGVYDPATGKRANTTSDITFDVIFYKVRDKEVDGIKIKINDIRIIFPQARISFRPNQSDFVTLNGAKMEIIQVREDPASSTWTLFIRGV